MRGNITRRGKRSWRLKFDVDTISGARRIRYVTVNGPAEMPRSSSPGYCMKRTPALP